MFLTIGSSGDLRQFFTHVTVTAAGEAILKWEANLGDSGGMLSRKILKFRASEMARDASFFLK